FRLLSLGAAGNAPSGGAFKAPSSGRGFFTMPMRLELKDIKGGVLEQDYSCTLADFPDVGALAVQDGPRFEEPIVFRLRFQRTGQIVEVDGRLSAFLQLHCARCLKPFRQEVSELFSVTFSPHAEDMCNEDDIELEADELGLVGYQDEILDLAGPLQEQLLMAIPIRPLCDVNCPGLCHECGADLNVSPCDCEKKPFNNKFSVLADVLGKK
ncbi:MAG: DUF177 domain-containing protein, partial [Desulfuromonadales bacterium]|nr:DUF177 domain-containing protein [Desulfuromonadales bacterium]MBN2792277.1 DUF177 domain-containing protein [Desulfuromonadales bacterium]